MDNTKKVILLNKKEECSGCSACVSACPVSAIDFREDNEGFLYPYINTDLCIQCGKCVRICPITGDRDNKESHKKYYAARINDSSVRMESSSGGIFSLLAEWIESKHGVIYGAEFDADYTVRHSRAEHSKEWTKFKTSKYLQSRMENIFLQVKNDLIAGRFVLFTGTPCQISGLINYLGETSKEKLITCDLICHGTPSPKIWVEYLKFIEKSNQRKIGYVNFRSKENSGWHRSKLNILDINGEVLVDEGQENNLFFKLFSNNLILRPSCYICKYADIRRPGDITLGDFWGIEKLFQEFDDNKGISLIICNTEKGENILEKISKDMTYFEVQQEQCIQPNLERPSYCPETRQRFWHNYFKRGGIYAAKQLGLISCNMRDQIIFFYDRVINKIMRLKRNEDSGTL